MLDECRAPKSGPACCPTGEARLTRGHAFPPALSSTPSAPSGTGRTHGEDEALANCYRNSLALAAENGIRTIAFPAISTGVYRFPLTAPQAIAVREVRAFLDSHPQIEQVQLVCFGREALQAFSSALKSS